MRRGLSLYRTMCSVLLGEPPLRRMRSSPLAQWRVSQTPRRVFIFKKQTCFEGGEGGPRFEIGDGDGDGGDGDGDWRWRATYMRLERLLFATGASWM